MRQSARPRPAAPGRSLGRGDGDDAGGAQPCPSERDADPGELSAPARRSEEHTSELQSQSNLVCRLLLEKKKKRPGSIISCHITSTHLCLPQLSEVEPPGAT